jgi:hypothetical protein
MYRCQLCSKNSKPHTPAYKITIEIRATRYPFREKANACFKLQKDGTTKFLRTHDRGGTGHETVREVTACPECAMNWKNGFYDSPQLE